MTLAELFGENQQGTRTQCGKNTQVGHCGSAKANAPNCVGQAYPTHC